MQIGVVFPQTEFGGDVGAVQAYAQGVDDLGFRHLIAYDHVLGADPAVHRDWTHRYTAATTFHEPFVLFGHLAALTGLELVTSVLVLPQRQTALVAKQAAEVDLLSRGQLRLGVGIGWNRVEYEGLGKDFESRGRSLDEQIGLLRRLWTEPSVSHRGATDTLIGAGIAPLPVQRPIPVWIGGRSTAAYRRMGRLANGWFPQMSSPDAEFETAARVVAQAATEAGRDPATIGLEPRLNWAGELNGFVSLAESWRTAGATHAAVDTMGAGLAGVDEHLKVLSEVARAHRAERGQRIRVGRAARDRDTPSLWKLPDTPRHTPAYSPFGMKTTRHARQAELNDLELWIDLARTVERAAIDAAFFADVIGPSHHIDGPSTSSSRPGAAHHRRGDRAAD